MMIEEMTAIFAELRTRGLCGSLNGFQRDWLHVGPSYLGTRKWQGLPVGMKPMFGFYWRLTKAGQADLASRVYAAMVATVETIPATRKGDL